MKFSSPFFVFMVVDYPPCKRVISLLWFYLISFSIDKLSSNYYFLTKGANRPSFLTTLPTSAWISEWIEYFFISSRRRAWNYWLTYLSTKTLLMELKEWPQLLKLPLAIILAAFSSYCWERFFITYAESDEVSRNELSLKP